MTSTGVDAVLGSLRARPSRREALAVLAGGLPGLVLLDRLQDASAKGKKGQRKRRRRNNRKRKKPTCDVCRSGCKFDSVQDAIDAAAPGATIELCAGVFDGPVSIDKNLTLVGASTGKGSTTLDGRGNGATVSVDGATVELKRLRITGGTSGNGGGILSEDSELTLTECVVSGNTADLGGGASPIFAAN